MGDFIELENLLIRTCKYDDFGNTFQKLKTDRERVIYIFNIMYENGFIPNATNRLKDAEESEKLRMEGNGTFARLCHNFDSVLYHKLLSLYTKSIALAPDTSKQLPLAYANRSAVLFKLGLYSECMQDIDRTLNLNCPDELKGKLYLCKITCLIKLKNHTAKSMIEEARYWINKMTLDSDKLKLQAKLDVLCQKIERKNIQRTSVKLEKSENEPALPVIRSYNKEVPCASDAVAINYDAYNGRHVVATRDIDVGEVLVVEEPYSLLLARKNILEHCSNCLRVCWATIPCTYCTYAMYCSEQCRDIEWSKCHDVECAVFPIMVNRDDFYDTDLLSLRLAVLAVKEAGDIQSLRTMLEEADKSDDPRTMGFSLDGKFHSNKYISLYSLERNTEKRSFPDLLYKTLHACFILYVLAKHTTLFGAKLPGDLRVLATNETVTFLGGLILRNQQIIPTNAHKFSEVRDLDVAVRGSAVTAFCSLFNHSCRSNIFITSRPQHIVSYALYPIKKGDQLLCAYGVNDFTVMPKSLRQQHLLEQYRFFCTCIACKENWSMGNKVKSLLTLFTTIGASDDDVIAEAYTEFKKCVDLILLGDVLDNPHIIEDLLVIIRMLYDHVPINCLFLNTVAEVLKLVYEYHGNKFVLPEM